MLSAIVVALQVVLELLRLRREHAASLGVSKLAPDDRRRLDGALVSAVRAKNTSDLEAFLRPGAAPAPPPVEIAS